MTKSALLALLTLTGCTEAQSACVSSGECDEGFACVDRECVPDARCHDDYDCAADAICVEARCVPFGTASERDGGAEHEPDAGQTSDAGATSDDGGFDAGLYAARCPSGTCVCEAPFVDCDGDPANGCEVDGSVSETCDGDDDDCDGTVDEGCGHTVSCSVFDDGYADLVGSSDAILLLGPHVACVPGGASGVCRRWFGRCATSAAVDGHTHAVTLQAFEDGYALATGHSDAVTINAAGKACVPGGPLGDCRRWFGRARTDVVAGHYHEVWCHAFNDGFADMTGTSNAFFFNAASVCIPNGTGGVQCRRWFGRCFTGPPIPG